MKSVGIDIGSRTIKLVVLDGDTIDRAEVVSAASAPLEAAHSLLAGYEGLPTVATGYGRDFLDIKDAAQTITEIRAHGIGARHFFGDAGAVIDIGGQDLKTISLDAHGRVARFEMNDRCAAGTGRFLEIMAEQLGYSLEQFAAAALRGKASIVINAQCTVFAESEVIGLINRNCPREDIARALHRTVAKRIAAMFSRLGTVSGRVVMTGGGARSGALVALVGEIAGIAPSVPPAPEIAGALGCAIHAQRVPSAS